MLHRGPLHEARSLSSQRSRSPMASRATPVGAASTCPPSHRTVERVCTAVGVSRTDSATRPTSARVLPRCPAPCRSLGASATALQLSGPAALPHLQTPDGSQPRSSQHHPLDRSPTRHGVAHASLARSQSAGSRPSHSTECCQRASRPPVEPSPCRTRGTIVITNTGKATPRAGSNLNVTAADFFAAVLHCRINRSGGGRGRRGCLSVATRRLAA